MKCGTAFPERADRLSRIACKIEMSNNFPLLKACSLETVSARRLKNSVINYLFTTLKQFYPNRNISNSANLLSEQLEHLSGLPNITPNGIILPKHGTFYAYNLVHAEVVQIFEQAGLPDHAEKIFAPISIRLVRGISRPTIDMRPRSTTKYHSDIWSGEPADAISVVLPVLGDTENAGIDWIEPSEMPKAFCKTLDDFTEGEDLIKNGQKYNFCFQNGDLLLFDSYLLHATQKKQDAARVSIDFRFIARQKSPGDAEVPGVRRDSYLNYEIWRNIGHNLELKTSAPLEAYNQSNDGTRDCYPGAYEIVKHNN